MKPDTIMEMLNDVGVVVIGRNEGNRLRRCLESVVNSVEHIVYVDSGSNDNSVEMAKEIGVSVVCLDLSKPFTAARARNAGYKKLLNLTSGLTYVQFIDGDCELDAGWLIKAKNYSHSNPNVAVVCGRLRERYPSKSIYNALFDIEWDTPLGEINACGGIALYQTKAFDDVAGFNPYMIAGEEPELCYRIREKGRKIWRLDADMALHDANMLSFKQWWKRSVRGGYAYSLGADMHGNSGEQYLVAEVKRIRLWALYIPLCLLLLGAIHYIYLLGFVVYPLQVARLALKCKKITSTNWSYAFFLTLGKFPEMQGEIKYRFNKFLNRKVKIIEYKNINIKK